MKHLVFILIQCGLLLGISSAVADSYRDLTSADGEAVRAKVLRYDKSSDMVLIEHENHKRYTVSPDSFCDADKIMIRNWELVEGFMSDSGLMISIERIEKILEEKKTQQGKENRRSWIPIVYYKIGLQNCTDFVFEGVKIEMVPFVNYECLWPDKNKDIRFKSEEPMQVFDLGMIKAKGNMEVSTKEIGMSECLMVTERAKVIRKDVAADFQGVWVRITMEFSGGNKVMREIKNPENLWKGIEWANATLTIDSKTMKPYTKLKDYLDVSGYGKY